MRAYTPLQRFMSLLKPDRKDIIQIFMYAIVAGLISLSLPLGIQAIINLIQAGRFSASWMVLVIVVIIGASLVGILSLMQLRITENLQQKIFIRASFEFAYRLPKIRLEALHDHYPPELANRFFDTLSIQKGTAKLLLDTSSAVLQIFFGLLLLSLYHPFFIVFGLLLVGALYAIFALSFKRGLATSLDESKYKYKVAGWLQEIAKHNMSFRKDAYFDFAMDKSDKLVGQYVGNREKHFSVIRSQYIHLIGFKVIFMASLLLIGGFLVISGKMNIGQFVAAEIILLLLINSVEKLIVGLEGFYDVLTSIEKIGQVTDMPIEGTRPAPKSCLTKITLEMVDVSFRFPGSTREILDGISLRIDTGEKIYVDGVNGAGKSTLIRILCGLLQPVTGSFFINDHAYNKIDLAQYRSQIAAILYGETPFEGTIEENITLGNRDISADDLKWAIDNSGLSTYVRGLPDGIKTRISPDGRQLSSSVAQKILIARSIAAKPRILLYEDPLDRLDTESARQIIDFLMAREHRWTIIISSPNRYWQEHCNRMITLRNGKIIEDRPC